MPDTTGQAPRFRIGVQKPPAAATYRYEMEALTPIGAEIFEIDASSDAEFAEQVRDFDALIGGGRRMTAEIIEQLERCKIIGFGSVGTDTVDIAAATAAGIVVTNTPDVFIEEVADHTMALLLASHRHLYEMRRLILEGRFREGHPRLREFPRLWGQTLGLIAFGNVARGVARRAKPFGLHVIAYDPYVSQLEMTAEGVEPVGLFELLERSDFVSNHGPLNEESWHMVSTDHFRAMKPSAIFLNNGRGPSVDEEALIAALQAGEIAGAALDVFETEPVNLENPLLEMENVIITPHVASASSRMRPESRRRLGQELALVLMGRWPRSAVNPQVLMDSTLERWQPHSMERGPNR